jgi:hypothetical protein
MLKTKNSFVTGVKTFSSTPERLVAEATSVNHSSNNGVQLKNNGSVTVFIFSAGGSTSTGYPLAASETILVPVDFAFNIWGATASSTSEVRFLIV